MKTRIKVITKGDGGKTFYPQYTNLGLFWSACERDYGWECDWPRPFSNLERAQKSIDEFLQKRIDDKESVHYIKYP